MTNTPVAATAPTAPRPQTVPTESLRPNPHNPRVLFDKEPMETLQHSIARVGILVPITVYQAAGSSKFTILDGQRRWTCATNLGLKEVPINQVAEPTLAQNIVTMFQIHKLRDDWELMPTALKLGVLMDELEERGDRSLSQLTGLDVAVVTRCKKLLSFPAKYQDMMLHIDPDLRMKADFFIELYPVINDRDVRGCSWFSPDVFTDAMIEKYERKDGPFRSVTDFRKIKAYLTAARKSGKIDDTLELLRNFAQSPDMEISDLEVDEARIHGEASAVSRSVNRLREVVENLDTELFVAEGDLWTDLYKLSNAIKQALEKAEWRA
jgi:ParB family chromosome partitioning protein